MTSSHLSKTTVCLDYHQWYRVSINHELAKQINLDISAAQDATDGYEHVDITHADTAICLHQFTVDERLAMLKEEPGSRHASLALGESTGQDDAPPTQQSFDTNKELQKTISPYIVSRLSS